MIRLRNLTLLFDQRGIAGLHGINLDIHEGEKIAVIGQNGSGKTTLLKVLIESSNTFPKEKRLSYQGNIEGDLSSISFFSPDLNNSFHHSDQKVLDYLKSCTNDIDDEKKLNLARSLADHFDITFQLKQSLQDLSSGQRQKVLLAGLLMTRPKVLVMDEPFNHLDPLTRGPILEELFQYLKFQHTSVIWATHHLDEALRFSDQIAFIHYGKLLQLSSPLELMTTPNNLPLAHFLGFKNIYHLSRPSIDHQWKTWWGELSLSPTTNGMKKISPHALEALVIVPETSWIEEESHENNNVKGTIQNMTISPQGVQYEILAQNQYLYYLQPLLKPLKSKGESIHLTPIHSELIVLPL